MPCFHLVAICLFTFSRGAFPILEFTKLLISGIKWSRTVHLICRFFLTAKVYLSRKWTIIWKQNRCLCQNYSSTKIRNVSLSEHHNFLLSKAAVWHMEAWKAIVNLFIVKKILLLNACFVPFQSNGAGQGQNSRVQRPSVTPGEQEVHFLRHG